MGEEVEELRDQLAEELLQLARECDEEVRCASRGVLRAAIIGEALAFRTARRVVLGIYEPPRRRP